MRSTSKVNRAFVAFSGGGAKGLIHVGALRALEDRNVVFRGLAGTSAGAIVAALRAAGLSSRDILDPDTGRSVIDRLHDIDPDIRHVTDIFGRAGWMRLRAFRWALGHVGALKIGTIVIGVTAAAVLLGAGATRSWPTLVAAIVLWVGLIAATRLGIRFLIGGLADIRRFQSALATLLQREMFPDAPQRIVRMGDFGRDGRPTLKIVGANLSLRRLHLFSPERTPEIPVADAVAASICLPVIFRPWEIDHIVFVDGGIVSNLPAWPFDEERELDPAAMTIAIAIADPPDREPALHRFNWLPSAIRTALFGSGELNLRASGQSEQLVLESKLDLLDFDMSLDEAGQEVRDGEAAAGVRLDKRLFRRPVFYRNVCETIRDLSQDIIKSILGIDPGRVRVAIAVPDRDYHHSLRFRFSSGYETDTDEGMLVPLDGSLLGAAWTSMESLFDMAPFRPDLDLPGDANEMRRKMRWQALAWQLCIPISDDDGPVRFAVQIDGDADLRHNAQAGNAATAIEKAVKETFARVMKVVSELEDGYGS